MSSKAFGSLVWLLALSLLLACSPPAALAKRPQTSLTEPATKSAATTSAAEDDAASGLSLDEPEGYPKAKPRSNSEIGSLTQAIVKGKLADREKARAIYQWIAQNISYDIKSFLAGDYSDPSPDRVVATRMAVCEGYSRLFVAMASAVGLEAVTIPGYSKGFSPQDEAPNRQKPNHAWNAVKLDGHWHLLDATWGSGHINRDGNFIQDYSLEWFDVAPEHFVYSHLPVEPKWQQLKQPLKAEKFWSLPTMSMNAFAYGLRLESHKESLIKSNGLLQLKISSAKPCSMGARLFKEGREVGGNYTLVEREGNNFTVSVLPPEAVKYTLVIFLGELKELNTQSALSYELVSSLGSAELFPKTFKAFTLNEVQLVSPRFIPARGQKTSFAIKAPGAYEVIAKMDGAQIIFSKTTRDTFEATTSYSGSRLTVYARYGNSNSYDGLLEF